MAFKPIDPKRDEFRRYLERSGVIEALTKVFVRIVKERPENPLDYLRHNLGDSLHQADSVAYLQSELEEARCEIQRLRGIIENVNPEALEEPPRGDEENIVENAASENQEQENSADLKAEEQNVAGKETENQTCLTAAAAAATASTTEPLTPINDIQKAVELDGNLEAPASDDSGNNISIPIPPGPTEKLDNNS